jgi:tetratricopeptide (TPR) repeat protein
VNQTPVLSGRATNSDLNRSISISGKVVMDDGSPVPPDIVIQRVCSGTPHAVAYADSQGRFSFRWAQDASSPVLADASEAGTGSRHTTGGGFGGSQSAGGSNPLAADPLGNRMMNCELRAELAGYRSGAVKIPNDIHMENSDVGLILLHRQGAREGSSVSATSFLAPKEAKKAYENGTRLLLKNKPDSAAKEFEKAVAIYPKYADAWMSLGQLRLQQKQYEPAKEALMKALDADPKMASPYIQLGMLAAEQRQWEDAARNLDRALKLDPIDYPEAWYVDAVADFNLKLYDAAEASARQYIGFNARNLNPRAHYLLGITLIKKRNDVAAIAELRTYIQLDPNAPDMGMVKQQLAEVEKFVQASPEEAGKKP